MQYQVHEVYGYDLSPSEFDQTIVGARKAREGQDFQKDATNKKGNKLYYPRNHITGWGVEINPTWDKETDTRNVIRYGNTATNTQTRDSPRDTILKMMTE